MMGSWIRRRGVVKLKIPARLNYKIRMSRMREINNKLGHFSFGDHTLHTWIRHGKDHASSLQTTQYKEKGLIVQVFQLLARHLSLSFCIQFVGNGDRRTSCSASSRIREC